MKTKLRKLIHKQRKQVINKEKKDQLLLNNLMYFISNYDKIMIYYPLENEPNILNIINDKSKSFYLPYCEKDKNISIRKIENIFDLEKDSMNIFSSKTKTNDNIDIVIVPALAMNYKMYRLGYGGGYYDRFFSNNKDVIKVAVVYQEFIIKDEFQDEWDISFDYIITEQEIIKKEVQYV